MQSQRRHPIEGHIIIVAILAAWYWFGQASLPQIIQKESGDPSATVSVKEVIIYMVLSLLAVSVAEELVRKLKK